MNTAHSSCTQKTENNSTMTMSISYFELPSNMERVCRICLSEGTNLSSIYCNEQGTEDFSSMSQKIQACGAIEIHERDGFPSLICEVCIYKANVAHEFRQQCQNSDARLRLFFDKPTRSSIVESSTQTELQTNYFVKQEMQGLNQELTNTIEVYAQNNDRIVTDAEVETEDKLFLCNIGFGGSKEMEKNTVILSAHPVGNCSVNDDNQVAAVTTIDQENLNSQGVTTIADMKSTDPAEQYITEHLLTTSADEDEDDAPRVDNNGGDDDDGNDDIDDDDDDDDNDDDDDVEDGNDDDEEEEENGGEIIHQEPKLEQSAKNNEEKWNGVTMENEESLPKRLTRKAKPIAGKSYSIDELDEDSQDDDQEPKFKCKICCKRYTTQKGLKNHSQVHDKKHECPTCLKLFYKLENLEKHTKIHQLKPHACLLCHTSFTKPQSLARHSKTHVEKTSINGNHQNNGDDTKINVKKDMKTENNDTDDDDDEHDTQTNETDEFDSTPGLYKCDVCDQFCSTLKNLKRHSLMHGDKKYSCTVCKKWFFRPDTLKKHAEKHGHGLLDNLVDENKLYESDDESFNRGNGNIMSDQNKKDDSDEDGVSGEYKCQHCDKVMATKKGLRRHVSMHKPKAEPVTCEICKKVCASQARLVLHQRTHNKPKEKVPREYLCHICSKVYPSNSSLTYHMRTHTGVKPHVCKTCNSGFTTTTSLANHIRIHTGDKPFVCHVCSAAFAVSSAFRRHLTRHTGEANYLCKTCGKAFKRLSTLKEHTYTHSGEKPYVCKTCGAAYSHSGSLFAHQKRCRAQYGEMITDDHHTHVAHHIHVNNVQSAVRSLAVIGQMF